MDATTGPHRIPPEMPQYGERHHVFEMMQSMLEQLLIHQPKDPLQFMIEHLQRNNDRGARLAAELRVRTLADLGRRFRFREPSGLF